MKSPEACELKTRLELAIVKVPLRNFLSGIEIKIDISIRNE